MKNLVYSYLEDCQVLEEVRVENFEQSSLYAFHTIVVLSPLDIVEVFAFGVALKTGYKGVTMALMHKNWEIV